MNFRKLYIIVLSACLVGYIWLIYQFNSNPDQTIGICIIKEITGIPCPSCGSTRSVIHLIKGDLIGAIYWNPFGILLILIMLIAPVWIGIDLLFKKTSFFHCYQKTESFLKKPPIAVIAIILVLLNWIWNISKGL